MYKVITWGIPGTGMPEFTTRLKTEEIAALVAYAMTLRGAASSASTPAPVAPPRTPPPDAKAGRALFFDASRMGACGTCHELDGWGVPAGPDIAASPRERLADLRRVPRSRVRTARPAGGEAGFPALLVENTEARVRVYGITGPLPCYFRAGANRLSPNTSWLNRRRAPHEQRVGSSDSTPLAAVHSPEYQMSCVWRCWPLFLSQWTQVLDEIAARAFRRSSPVAGFS